MIFVDEFPSLKGKIKTCEDVYGDIGAYMRDYEGELIKINRPDSNLDDFWIESEDIAKGCIDKARVKEVLEDAEKMFTYREHEKAITENVLRWLKEELGLEE